MIDFFSFLDDFFWSYVGFSMLTLVGLYLTIRTGGLQFRVLASPLQNFRLIASHARRDGYGISPWRLYFTSIGGMIGLGNIIAVTSVVVIGGPGGIFWMWVAAFLGMMVKYGEIYLGMTYRQRHPTEQCYQGGPMYYLREAFNSPWPARIVAMTLCIYGVEIAQFVMVRDHLSTYLEVSPWMVTPVLLVVVLYAGLGGMRRVSTVCTWLMPPLLVLYIGLGVGYCVLHWEMFLSAVSLIIPAAFHGQEAVAGFAGAGVITAARYGTARAVYSGDIGIGYDAVVQSNSTVREPQIQARIAFFALLTDAFICTISCLIVLTSGLWRDETVASDYVLAALTSSFPYVHFLMLMILAIAGFTTIVGYYAVGQQCARYLHPRLGHHVFFFYSIAALLMVSFWSQQEAMLVMSLSSAVLVTVNVIGVLRLSKHIK
jgi:AGCS family alanine or glycine:cation symporter